MTIICMSRTDMRILQFDKVYNIAYNTSAGTFTLAYGSNTTTLQIADYTIHIMTS